MTCTDLKELYMSYISHHSVTLNVLFFKTVIAENVYNSEYTGAFNYFKNSLGFLPNIWFPFPNKNKKCIPPHSPPFFRYDLPLVYIN